MQGEKFCRDCIYFTPNDLNPVANDFWCHRHNMSVRVNTQICPKYDGHKGLADKYNAQYLGLMERENDRKSEQTTNFLLSAGVSILAVVIGVILGYWLKS